ncbi:MAG: hypothetical protein ABJG78_19050 [Cyclobacteriaceae bacterium]
MESSKQKNHLKDPEYIVAFGVVLISVCALVVSIRQTNIMSEQRVLMHEQAKAAVWPRITLGVSKSHSQKDNSIVDYKINLSNAGVGPAIIKYVKVSYDGNVATSWHNLFDYFNMPDSLPLYISNSNISQNIIRAGDVVRILGFPDNLPLAQIFYEHSDKVEIEIYYESIYGDMWKYSTSPTGENTEALELIPQFSNEEAFQN